MNNDIIVIPDVHGRSFWRPAVERYPGADIIFLGDYLDPYPAEEITPEHAISNFNEIIAFAKTNKNCQLLLGNHDLHYLCDFGEGCRMDYLNLGRIRSKFKENLGLFRIMTYREINGKRIVFSHAPILDEWIKSMGETENIQLLYGRMNALLNSVEDKPWEVESYLGQISLYRGGFDDFGSPVWADVRELLFYNIIKSADYSLFGHTQQVQDPIITEKWACLDCRKAFRLTSDMEILQI